MSKSNHQLGSHAIRHPGYVAPSRHAQAPAAVERSEPKPTFLRLTSPKLIGAEFDQLIGAAAELGGIDLSWRTVPSFGGASIVWMNQKRPPSPWLRELERELHTFATINGLTVAFYHA